MKKHNAARLISLVMVLAMMLVLCFAFATPASAASHEVGTMEDLQRAIAGAAKGDVIYLTNDITLTGATESISVKATVTITSKQDDTKEGTEIYTITRAVAGFPMFSVDANSTRIILTNVTLDGANLADTTSNGGAIGQAGSSVSARYAEIREGATIKNFQANNGGAIYIRVAEIEGGTIENCTAAGSGGGVYSWSCIMTSGTIDGCKAAKGGGVYSAPISGTPSKFTGGLITGCEATNFGGGIVLTGSKEAQFSGVTILNCTAVNDGGGVYSNMSGTIAFSNGKITGCTAGGGGGGFRSSSGTLTISGGEISDNTAKNGGGVSLPGGTLIMTGGTITDNAMARTTAMNGGAMLVSENANAYLAGGDITENHHYKSTCVETASLEADADGKYPKDYELVSFVRNEDGSIELKTVATKLREKVDGKQVERSRSEFTITVPATTDRLTRSQINLGGTAYLGKTITLAEALSDEVKAALKNVTVSEDGLAVTTANLLNMVSKTAQPAFINNTAEKLILTSELVDGSRVVMDDSKSAFMGVESGVSNVDFIFLANADAAYRPTLADNTLTWPTEAYQLYQSAGLREDIAYRIYIAYRNATKKATTTVTFGGKQIELGTVSEELALAVGQPLYEGLTYAEIEMAPKYVNDAVTVAIGSDTKDYNLATYLGSLKGSSEKLDTLVDAILNYASAAQVYFEYNQDALANADYRSALKAIDSDAATFNLEGDNVLAFHSAEVGVGSKVSVAVIVKEEFAKTKDSVTVQLGGVDVDFEIAEIEGVTEYVAIAIYDISAADLLKVITVAIDGATLTYSVPTYAYNMQNKGGNDNLVAIVQALYAYAAAAAEYAK